MTKKRGKSDRTQQRQKHVTRGGLIRETAYLYADEEQALEKHAEQERCSKSEVIRRALRAYLDIE